MKKLAMIITIGILIISCTTNEKSQRNHNNKFKSLDLADGTTFDMTISGSTPLPAENNLYKIELAGPGISVLKAEENQKNNQLYWKFAFNNKKKNVIESVKVETVFPNKKVDLSVLDNQPELKDDIWYGRTNGITITPTNVPWLYSTNDGSTFVFKISIKAKNEPVSILYQPCYISESAKIVLNKYK